MYNLITFATSAFLSKTLQKFSCTLQSEFYNACWKVFTVITITLQDQHFVYCLFEELINRLSTGITQLQCQWTQQLQNNYCGKTGVTSPRNRAAHRLHIAHKPSGGKRGENRPSVLPICLSRSAASSGVARGRTPGSLKLVRSRVPITKKKSIPPIAGIAGVIFSDKYGQLEKEKNIFSNQSSNNSNCSQKLFVIINVYQELTFSSR